MASELEVGKAKLGTIAMQGDALLGARVNGDSINFGHANQSGYGSNLGCGNNNGHPYLAFMCEHGTNDNTFRTRGEHGNVIQATATGELKFSQVTNASADNQTATDRFTINAAGRTDVLANTNGDWAFKANNAGNTGWGALIVAGGSTATQIAFEVRKATSDVAMQINGTGLCTFSNGINLGDTTLSNYKEGTFAPTLAKGSTSVTSPNTAKGRYVRVGKQLFVTFYYYKTGAPTTTGSDNWTIQGLPFACVTGETYQSVKAGYVLIQNSSYQHTSPYRWQVSTTDGTSLLLFGTQATTNNTGGSVEFSGFGVLEIA